MAVHFLTDTEVRLLQSLLDEHSEGPGSRIHTDFATDDHPANWIEFSVDDVDGFTTDDETVTVTVDAYHDGFQPGTPVTVIYNKTAENTTYLFEGSDNEKGVALYMRSTNRYLIVQMECDEECPQGETGPQGSFGGPSAGYAFDTGTADSDPGAGKLRYNNAAPASATTIYVNHLDENGSDMSSWYASFGDSTNPVKGILKVFKQDDMSKFAIFTVP